MFAVPGWSVDSSTLKQQTIAAKPAPPKPTDTQNANSEDGASTNGKKRKRSGKEVNKNNLGDMWEQVIEGKPKQKKVKKEKDAGVRNAESKVVKDGGADSIPAADGEKKKKKKDKKGKKDKKRKSLDGAASTVEEIETASPAPPPPPAAAATKLTPLQAAMRQKLISARFRHLNQTLYTTPSTQSLDLVTSDPEIFNEYHEGFRRQVEVWPENPVDGYLQNILTRGAIRSSSTSKAVEANEQPLPRTGKECTIADLGCGDAALSKNLQPHLKKHGLKIHSFDLHSASPLITKADIASLPLADNSVDVAIFCLALMGTNWIDFIEEAFRVLRWKGELWISEIKSRFSRAGSNSRVVDHSVGKRQKGMSISQGKEMKKSQKHKQEMNDDAFAAVEVDGQPSTREETDVSAFVEVLRRRGFVLRGEGRPGGEKEGVDLKNKMFVKMWFVKSGKPTKGKGVNSEAMGAAEKGREGTWKHKSRKSEEVNKEADVGDEGAVLKPCVYKLR